MLLSSLLPLSKFFCHARTTLYAGVLGVVDDWAVWRTQSRAFPRLICLGTVTAGDRSN
jgi:hypothetical protein